MSLINRNITRTIKNSTETTLETNSNNSDTLAFNLSTSDEFYLGFKKPFTTRYFNLSVVNSVSNSVSVKYWNGTQYTAVNDLVDQTVGFTQSGFLSWQNATGWQESNQSPISDHKLFWIEVTVDTGLHADTVLQSVQNIFCDANLVRAYYPELITDASYLPTGRTDFIEQFQAASRLVVQRLKQDGIIEDESQIIDVNDVCIAAVHAFAWIVLNPISQTDESKSKLSDIWDTFNNELNKSHASFDYDDSGVIEDDEENIGTVFIKRG